MTRAYKFLRSDYCSGAGSEPVWQVGETRRLEGELAICARGYHSSPSWLDALRYAPGTVAALVKISEPEEPELRQSDKTCSREMTVLGSRDVSRELRLFGADCAERVLLRERERGREPDKRLWAAVEAARQFAAGAIVEGRLKANAAAYATANATAYAAAYAAAYAPANAAADATREAERAWQRQRLADYLDPLFTDVQEESRG